jgi:serine protease Do
VIDIDGDGFPYLDWYGDEVATGMTVYAAGFPLGDPEYTLTEGIISKEKANGETNWASVDSVVEHTAKILPGNSGGPLVTPDGQVVAVNYAAYNEFDLNYAIGRDEAMKVLDDLTEGRSVTSIGVNGEAFLTDELSGIWVSAVESGSPAANVGIKGGDIITQLEGLVLATDGTMSDYCDILRSHESSDPLSIEILRFETQEVLEGVLNSGEELTLAFSFAEELGEDVDSDPAVAYDYTEVYDDDGLLVMQVPTAWAEIDGQGWDLDGEIIGNAIIAAPSLSGFYETWETPGVFFGASEVLIGEIEPGDLLNWWDFSDSCTYDGTYDYEDIIYAGAYDVWLDCGGTNTAFVVLEAYPEDEEFVILVQIQIVSDADLEAFDAILASFEVLTG